MRKIVLIMLMVTAIASFVGCSKDISLQDKSLQDGSLPDKIIQDGTSKGQDKKDDANEEYQIFEADVIETEDRLLIAPDKESREYNSSDRIVVGLLDTNIFDDKGSAVDVNYIKSGDRLRIYYNGLMAESYPAQISADKIEIIGHNDILHGFFTLIDDIYQEDSALNNNISMIALDTRGLDILSEVEIDTIVSMISEEYQLDVIQASFDELVEQGLIDKDNLYFENGILIDFKDVVINKNQSKITCSISKWRSGLGAIGWEADAELQLGEWKISRSKMWIS